MKVIGLLIYPTQSHILATFNIARILRNDGYRIIYLGHNGLKDVFYKQGFEFFPINSFPFAKGFEESVLTKESKLARFARGLVSRLSGDLYAARKIEFDAFMKSMPIDYLFIDTFLAADFLFFLNIYHISSE